MYICLDLNSQYTVKPKCIEIRLSCKMTSDLRWWGVCGKRDIMRKWWIIPAIRQLLFRITHMIFLTVLCQANMDYPEHRSALLILRLKLRQLSFIISYWPRLVCVCTMLSLSRLWIWEDSMNNCHKTSSCSVKQMRCIFLKLTFLMHPLLLTLIVGDWKAKNGTLISVWLFLFDYLWNVLLVFL